MMTQELSLKNKKEMKRGTYYDFSLSKKYVWAGTICIFEEHEFILCQSLLCQLAFPQSFMPLI